MIRKNNKRALYESIMKDVSKTVKKRLNESTNRFYPEDWDDINTAENVINAILEALYQSGIYYSFYKSINYAGLDPRVFTSEPFLQEFGKQLSNDVEEACEQYKKDEFDED